METTLAGIESELAQTQEAIDQNELLLLAREVHEDHGSSQEQHSSLSPSERLAQLDQETAQLLLTQELLSWYKDEPALYENTSALSEKIKSLQELEELLLSHKQTSLSAQLYEQEFLPHYKYLHHTAVKDFRNELKQMDYPVIKKESVENIDFHPLRVGSQRLMKLRRIRHDLETALTDAAAAVVRLNEDVVTELCRPLVERVKYHFLSNNNAQSTAPTQTRTDRLPEWLCHYIKEHVFESPVWTVAQQILSSAAATDFVNEILRLVLFVLEERQYFRHDMIAGQNSKPHILVAAVQHFLEFDSYLQDLLLENGDRVIRLFDACIAADEQLLSWWLDRERESILSTLFDSTIGVPQEEDLMLCVSPRAELFVALMRSVCIKASAFTFRGPYLNQVASPLCEQFLEAVQESSDDLQQLMVPARGVVPVNDNLRKNIQSWMELINGVHAAATLLSSTGHLEQEDLMRFGHAVGKLQDVLVDEFGRVFVDVLLMERAKLASYLMRCSYLLASDGDDDEEDDSDATVVDLLESQRLVSIFLDTCRAQLKAAGNGDEDDDDSIVQVGFAARVLRDCVLNRLSDKFLVPALDTDGTTPDLRQSGCMSFARHVDGVFQMESSTALPPLTMRLRDVTRLMSMPSEQLVGVGDALCGLAGRPAPLPEDIFEEDDRLQGEAQSMVQAKGFAFVQLRDVITVLNRRRDLASTEPTE